MSTEKVLVINDLSRIADALEGLLKARWTRELFIEEFGSNGWPSGYINRKGDRVSIKPTAEGSYRVVLTIDGGAVYETPVFLTGSLPESVARERAKIIAAQLGGGPPLSW